MSAVLVGFNIPSFTTMFRPSTNVLSKESTLIVCCCVPYHFAIPVVRFVSFWKTKVTLLRASKKALRLQRKGSGS